MILGARLSQRLARACHLVTCRMPPNYSVRLPIRSVVFDLDGLLIDTEPIFEESARRLLARRGLTVLPHVLQAMMGCMLEGPIGVAAAAHVAAACAGVVTRVDLDGPSLCTFDPVRSNVAFDGPHIRLAEGPGLGIMAIEGLEPIDA